MSPQYALGIDLGGTDLKGALVDHCGKIVARLSRSSQADQGPQTVIDGIAQAVDELRAGSTGASSVTGSTELGCVSVVGLGLGTPGPLSPSLGIIFQMANLPGWRDVKLREKVADRTQLPVVMDNDGNVAAYGEYCAAGDASLKNLVMLTLGTGIGAGVVLDGGIYHGFYENASEWGHMIVALNGRPCSCGQRGCIEQYASAEGVANRFVEAVREGQPSTLAERVRAGQAVTAADVAQAATAGDHLAERIWDDACRYLAAACVNIQHALNPQIILLGGGMSKAGDFLLHRVQVHFEAMRWKLHDDHPEIALARLGNDAGVIGAAMLAWNHFGK